METRRLWGELQAEFRRRRSERWAEEATKPREANELCRQRATERL